MVGIAYVSEHRELYHTCIVYERLVKKIKDITIGWGVDPDEIFVSHVQYFYLHLSSKQNQYFYLKSYLVINSP